MNKALHWTQRIALVRHNLHTAHLSHDFTFFKTLSAQALFDNTNHVATLSATLGDSADVLLSGLDDLNASIAHVHEDAFKNVYNSLKTYLGEGSMDEGYDSKSKIFVDAVMQKQMADHGIDKATSSAIALIQQQPAGVQETAANVWITGTAIVADSIEVCLQQMATLETNMQDFIRLEESWNTVKASVSHSVSALKCVFNLMTPEEPESPTAGAGSSNSGSFSSTMFRRLSNAFSTTSAPTSRSSSFSLGPPPQSRSSSSAPEYRMPNYIRNSVSNACPTSLPTSGFGGWKHTQLDAIPPTPAVMDDDINPFDTSVPPMPAMSSLSDVRVEQAVMCLL